MSKLSNEYSRVQLRATAAHTNLAPANDTCAIAAMENVIKVQKFIEPIARLSKREGTNIRGWSPLHVPFFHSLYSTLSALVLNQSLSTARGNGRMATIVDNTYSSGSGLRVRAKGILSFLELEGVEWTSVPLGTNEAFCSFPILPELYRSGEIFEVLRLKLANRITKVAAHDALKGSRMTRLERQQFNEEKSVYLIKPTWTTAKIEQTAVEFLSRAFALSMNPDIREELVLSSPGNGLTFSQALDTLQLKSLN